MLKEERIDPILFEVIRNSLTGATEEMALSLRRSSYSTNIKTRSDFSCAYFDEDFRPVAQSFSQPNHLGSLVETVRQAVRHYGSENLSEGDALMTNDPYRGGVHLNDIAVISRVFYRGQARGYVANTAHHVDVGGGAPASLGSFKEVYQEGVIIPPVKLVRGGAIVEDIFRLVMSQIRSKHETAGDFRAQIAANNTGIRRLGELWDRRGLEVVSKYIDELIEYTRRRVQADLAKLPRGTFEAEGQVDTDGYTDDPVHLQARIVIDEEGVFFDLAGCDPQRRAPVNSTYSQTYSACAYALKCLIDPDIPANAGSYEAVRMNAPLGTVVNCTHPFPVVGGWETPARLTDVFFRALAPAMPQLMPAGTKAMICHSGFGGLDPVTSEYYCFMETLGGGYGGRATKDGPSAVQMHGQNTENAPIEETELNYPVRIDRYELVNDSDGAGEFRGGLGLRRDYTFPDRPTTFTILADRDKEGPWGLFGGQSGRKAEYVLIHDGVERRVSSKTTLELLPGDVVSYRTCGGGGYGHPHERDPERVLRDVRNNYVSLERARSVYGVAIDPTRWAVDMPETERLRAGQADS